VSLDTISGWPVVWGCGSICQKNGRKHLDNRGASETDAPTPGVDRVKVAPMHGAASNVKTRRTVSTATIPHRHQWSSTLVRNPQRLLNDARLVTIGE
jgi:hypothetical protein